MSSKHLERRRKKRMKLSPLYADLLNSDSEDEKPRRQINSPDTILKELRFQKYLRMRMRNGLNSRNSMWVDSQGRPVTLAERILRVKVSQQSQGLGKSPIDGAEKEEPNSKTGEGQETKARNLRTLLDEYTRQRETEQSLSNRLLEEIAITKTSLDRDEQLQSFASVRGRCSTSTISLGDSATNFNVKVKIRKDTERSNPTVPSADLIHEDKGQRNEKEFDDFTNDRKENKQHHIQNSSNQEKEKADSPNPTDVSASVLENDGIYRENQDSCGLSLHETFGGQNIVPPCIENETMPQNSLEDAGRQAAIKAEGDDENHSSYKTATCVDGDQIHKEINQDISYAVHVQGTTLENNTNLAELPLLQTGEVTGNISSIQNRHKECSFDEQASIQGQPVLGKTSVPLHEDSTESLKNLKVIFAAGGPELKDIPEKLKNSQVLTTQGLPPLKTKTSPESLEDTETLTPGRPPAKTNPEILGDPKVITAPDRSLLKASPESLEGTEILTGPDFQPMKACPESLEDSGASSHTTLFSVHHDANAARRPNSKDTVPSQLGSPEYKHEIISEKSPAQLDHRIYDFIGYGYERSSTLPEFIQTNRPDFLTKADFHINQHGDAIKINSPCKLNETKQGKLSSNCDNDVHRLRLPDINHTNGFSKPQLVIPSAASAPSSLPDFNKDSEKRSTVDDNADAMGAEIPPRGRFGLQAKNYVSLVEYRPDFHELRGRREDVIQLGDLGNREKRVIGLYNELKTYSAFYRGPSDLSVSMSRRRGRLDMRIEWGFLFPETCVGQKHKMRRPTSQVRNSPDANLHKKEATLGNSRQSEHTKPNSSSSKLYPQKDASLEDSTVKTDKTHEFIYLREISFSRFVQQTASQNQLRQYLMPLVENEEPDAVTQKHTGAKLSGRLRKTFTKVHRITQMANAIQRRSDNPRDTNSFRRIPNFPKKSNEVGCNDKSAQMKHDKVSPSQRAVAKHGLARRVRAQKQLMSRGKLPPIGNGEK